MTAAAGAGAASAALSSAGLAVLAAFTGLLIAVAVLAIIGAFRAL